MRLHSQENNYAFNALIVDISERTNIRTDVLEKDYYVSLILKELSEKQHDGLEAYFKGGTALYKALKSIRRFSEDIDLTVKGVNDSQKKKNLQNSTRKYQSLKYVCDEQNIRGSIVSIYEYVTQFDLGVDDRLQRFGRVKVESTSFTVSEPIDTLIVSPILYDMATEEQKQILQEQYDVKPFDIGVIALDRIFVDKIFATEYYFRKAKESNDFYYDVAKHLYDITVLFQQESIKQSISNVDRLSLLVKYKRKEEISRKGSEEISALKICDFLYLHNLKSDKTFKTYFERMQNIYVFSNADILSVAEVYNTLEQINRVFEGY